MEAGHTPQYQTANSPKQKVQRLSRQCRAVLEREGFESGLLGSQQKGDRTIYADSSEGEGLNEKVR
jgi:hypothetical protein